MYGTKCSPSIILTSPPSILQVKDVRVPENLQRAMAAEAEAARNARAKVVLLISTTTIRKTETMVLI